MDAVVILPFLYFLQNLDLLKWIRIIVELVDYDTDYYFMVSTSFKQTVNLNYSTKRETKLLKS